MQLLVKNGYYRCRSFCRTFLRTRKRNMEREKKFSTFRRAIFFKFHIFLIFPFLTSSSLFCKYHHFFLVEILLFPTAKTDFSRRNHGVPLIFRRTFFHPILSSVLSYFPSDPAFRLSNTEDKQVIASLFFKRIFSSIINYHPYPFKNPKNRENKRYV